MTVDLSFGMQKFMEEGVKVVVTPERGAPKLRTILLLDGDIFTFVHRDSLNKRDLIKTHFERVDGELSGIRRLRQGLNILHWGSTLIPSAHLIHSCFEDWQTVFWNYAPYTLISVLGLAIRPLFFTFIRRKLT